MSYLVLARKWRPRRFSELVGQQHVVRALRNGIETGRLHHAFLFTGTRGVGKTTIARILAKALNCERGVSADPCGVCSACSDIDAGRYVDLLEIDAASRTKVDDTRDLLDNVIYAPARGLYKVYLIDEVHMLSTASFNALLKTLEEPPPHVKFLLATTDPQKLPVTVLSRCLQFSLKRLERGEIESQMQRILEAEGLGFDASALQALARAADGSLRDGLSLLDQALAFGSGSVRHEDVMSMLGTIDREALLSLARALTSGDRPALRGELQRIAELSIDYSALLVELLTLWHDVAARQTLGDDVESELVDDTSLAQFAEVLGPEEVQLYYQLCLLARRDLDLAPDHRTGFEMTMLRLLAFRPQPEQPDGQRHAVPTAVSRSASAANPTPPIGGVAEPRMSMPVSSRPPAAHAAAGDAGSAWFDLLERAAPRGPAHALAAQLRPVSHEGAHWRLALAANCDSLNTEFARRALEEALRASSGEPIKLDIRAETGPGGENLAERSARTRAAQLSAADAAVAADPGVQALTREFGARIIPGSLKINQ